VNKVKMDALKEMSKEDSKKEYEEIPAHEVKCPKCGHKWTMGEDEEEEYEDED
jgi:hypothetical protein